MSDLSNELPPPEDSSLESEKTSSPVIMLVSMLLLTAVLILTGSMMFHYAKAGKAPSVQTAEAEQEESPGLTAQAAALLQSFKEPSSQDAPDAEAEKTKGGGLSGLFNSRDGSARWPKLELTGFGTSTGGREAFAIINNQQYHPGQLINGKVTVVEVRDHDVVVEYQGESRHLTVNAKH